MTAPDWFIVAGLVMALLTLMAGAWLLVRGSAGAAPPPAPAPIAPPPAVVPVAPPPPPMAMVQIVYHDTYGNEVGRESIPKHGRRVTRTYRGHVYQADKLFTDGVWHYRVTHRG